MRKEFIKNLVESYTGQKSWRVAENANARWSYSGLQSYLAGALLSDYALDEIYTPEIKKAHKEHSIHIHDLNDGGLIFYCLGHSLKQILKLGFGGVEGKVDAKPAKHFNAVLGQIVNFIGTLQNEASGAQALSSFDTYLAPFIRYDKLDEGQIKQALQEFMFSINQSSRWSLQIPFSNITMDLKCPKNMEKTKVIIGGKEQEETYGNFQKEMDMFNKALIELFIEGDGLGRPFSFPIPTINITKDFDWDSEVSQKLFFLTSKYGTPYFQNFINSTLEPDDVFSMCPMTGDSRVVVKSKGNGIRVTEIKDVYSSSNSKGTKYEVWTPEGWCKGIPNKQEKQKIYEITLSNGFKIKLGENHIQPIKNNESLQIKNMLNYFDKDYWIPFSKNVWEGENGNFQTGAVIGAYIGDGSKEKHRITYSLSSDKKDDETETYIRDFFEPMGYKINTNYNERNVRFVTVSGKLTDFIERYVNGNNALEKSLTRYCFNSSKDFRRGLIYGLRLTDGARDRKRIYTSSPNLARDITELLGSLGKKWMQNYEDNREGRFGTNTNYRIDYPERKKYGELFDEDENYHYFKVVDIKEVKKDYDLYCFEIDNYNHLFTLASGMITHNCRLRLNMKELRNKTGGLFGAGEQTGSIGVVTINMPQLAYKNKGNKEKFYKELKRLMDLNRDSLEIKRKKIEQSLKEGIIPYTKVYLGTTKNHFSTIGLNGMHEACLNFLGKDKGIQTEEGKTFALEVMDFMRDRLVEYQEETKNMYNLEASPAEGTAHRFAKWDKEHYPEIIVSGINGEYFYTNSTQLPVDNNGDVFDALKLQDELQCKYTGGTVFHAFIGERINDWRTTRNLIRKIAENFKMPYYTISPTFSICPTHKYISGEHAICPIDGCNKQCEIYSRIVGYYRPVKQWNKGKQREFKDRKEFNV